MIIDAEKVFDKIQHPFMIKNPPESRHKRNIPQNNSFEEYAVFHPMLF